MQTNLAHERIRVECSRRCRVQEGNEGTTLLWQYPNALDGAEPHL